MTPAERLIHKRAYATGYNAGRRNAWPDHKLAVEIEGGAWIGGRHVRGSGFMNDMEKYNELTLMGWSLLRFTPRQVKNGEAVGTLLRWFAGRRK